MSKSLYTTIIEETAPTTTTVGVVGQLYLDSITKILYQCVAINIEDLTYEWKLINDKGTVVNINNIKQSTINFDSDPQTQIDTKVDKVNGKQLSTNDYTNADKNKLAGIETGAQVNKPVDAALSATSTNPVQNKVVTEAINNRITKNGGETGKSFVLSSNGRNFYSHSSAGTVIGANNEPVILKGSSSNPTYIGGDNNLQNIVLEKDLTDLKEFDWQYVTTYILNQTSDSHWAIVPNFDFTNYDYYFESTLILEDGGFNGLMFTDANSNVLTFNVRWNRIATEGGSGSGSSTQWAGYQAAREDNIIYGVDTMSGSRRFIRETIKLSRQANTTGSDDSGPNIDFEFNSWAAYAGNQRNYMVRGYVYPTDTTNTLSIKGISRFVSEGTTGYLPNSFMRMYRRKRRNETGG